MIFISYISLSERGLVFHYLLIFSFGFVSLLYYDRIINISDFWIFILILGCLVGCSFGVTAAIVSMLSAVLIFIPINKPLPILSFLGTISYSLYLVHQPLGDRIINLATRLPNNTYLQISGLTVAVTLSIATAWVLWRFVERPSTSLAKKITVLSDSFSVICEQIPLRASPTPSAGPSSLVAPTSYRLYVPSAVRELQSELLEPRSHRIEKTASVVFMLKARHQIVGVAHEYHVVGGLAPSRRSAQRSKRMVETGLETVAFAKPHCC